jgi:hypothetical protein
MALALEYAIVGRDVSHLIFPDGVQTRPAREGALARGPQGRVGAPGIAPPAAALATAAERLRAARRPVIIVGHGARFDMDAVLPLAERLNAPVLTIFKGKGVISDRHPLGCGVLGRSGTPIASWFMNEADLLPSRPATSPSGARSPLGGPRGLGALEGVQQEPGGDRQVPLHRTGQYLGELTTAVKYGMPITHVLLDNGELGTISKEQRAGMWDVWRRRSPPPASPPTPSSAAPRASASRAARSWSRPSRAPSPTPARAWSRWCRTPSSV